MLYAWYGRPHGNILRLFATDSLKTRARVNVWMNLFMRPVPSDVNEQPTHSSPWRANKPCNRAESCNMGPSRKYGLACLSVPTPDNSIHPTSICYLLKPTSRSCINCQHNVHVWNSDARPSLSELVNLHYWYECLVTSFAEWEIRQEDNCNTRTSLYSDVHRVQMENIGEPTLI